jgi:undecaprenyl-diphosphatase
MTDQETVDSIQRRSSDGVRLVLGTTVLVGSAVIASQRHIEPVESDLFRFVNRLPVAASVPLRIIMQAGALGASFVTAGLALVARRPRLARDLAVSGTLAWWLAKLVKAIVARDRPGKLLDDVRFHGSEATGLGFPSGHAAVSAALATAAGPYLPPAARGVAWAVAGLVGLSRVYVGAHLPIDVLGGTPLGWAVGAAVHLVWGAPEE